MSSAVVVGLMPATAEAQTALEGIVVESASPVQRRKPVPSPKPVRAPVRSAAVAPAAAPPPEPPWWATSLTIPPEGSFTSVAVLGAAEGLSRGAQSLGDSLGTKPGVSATSFSPVASRPVIRGLGGFRVRTQEGGIGSHDMANLGEDHAVTIDPLIAGNVEVVRGPGTLRYGSQAIGGVVSASNNRIPTFIPKNGVASEVKGGVSSVNRGYDSAAILDAGGNNFAIHLDAFRRQGGDYQIPGGRQENSSFYSQGGAAGGSYIFNDGFIGVAYQATKMTYFIPGIDSAAAKNHIDLQQSKWTSRGEWRVGEYGLDTLKYWLGYSDYRHDEVDGVGFNAEVGSVFKNRELEARTEVSHLPVNTWLGELRGAAGVQYGRRNLSVLGADDPLLAPARANNVAAFVFEELQLTPLLRAQAAGRIERTDIDGTGAIFPADFLPPPNRPDLFASKRAFVPKSVSSGLLYDLPFGMVARVTAQHVERSPDPIELYYKGPHDTPRTFEIGDPNLKMEKADTVEIGLKRGRGDFRFEASAYHTKFKNFIFKNFTGFRCGDDFASCGAPGGTFDQIIYSQRDARFIGGEIQAEYDVTPLWNGVFGIEGQYDIVRATFTDGSSVPKIPPHRLGGGLYYRDLNWLARINLLHAFSQTRLGAFETPTPGYNLLNAELSYTVRKNKTDLSPELTVGLKGENLLNDRIRLHQSFKKDEVLQPGLNVRLFASMKLN